MPAYFNLQGSIRKAPHSPSRDTTRQRIKFSDERVCKSHLLNCCPHDILSGTRMDLGECLKVHDLALRADYEIASKQQVFFFELDAMDHLQSFIADCNRRTDIAKRRLADTQEEISSEVAAKAEKVHELNEEIGKLLAKAEQLGAEGNVEESQKIMNEVEKTRIQKREAEEIYRNSMPASSFQQQKLRVCEVCSAYLGLHDNDRRLADHFGGKLHLGFIEIREKLDELKRIVAEMQEKRNQDRLKRREERDKEERDKLKRRNHITFEVTFRGLYDGKYLENDTILKSAPLKVLETTFEKFINPSDLDPERNVDNVLLPEIAKEKPVRDPEINVTTIDLVLTVVVITGVWMCAEIEFPNQTPPEIRRELQETKNDGTKSAVMTLLTGNRRSVALKNEKLERSERNYGLVYCCF
ncbi:putative RNA-binding protein Luc7-like 2 isoform X2 [Phyllobates terribilis]|uniref:putative RNA-binding protein Luc7-like 2 isoform X2 n=1 Tax=Phyllobates terribilis TaxID=111132 RepID=UPI003CCA95B1